MRIIIESHKALPIMRKFGYPSWDKMDFHQRRQVAMEVYQNDNTPSGIRTYELVATGNPNANSFVYQVTSPDSNNTNWPAIIGIGAVAAFLLFR